MAGNSDDRSPPRKRQRRPQTAQHSVPENAVWDNEEEYSQALLNEPDYGRLSREDSAGTPSLDQPPVRSRRTVPVEDNDARQARRLQKQECAGNNTDIGVQTPGRRRYTPRFQSTTSGLRLLSPDSDEEPLDEDSMRQMHRQLKSASRRQVADEAVGRPPSGPRPRDLSGLEIDPRKLLWWELEQLVPHTVPLQRVREWQAVLDRIPSESQAPTSDRTYFSQHPRTVGADLRRRPTLPDYIPSEYPNIAIQAYKLSSKKVDYTDIVQRTPGGSKLARDSPEAKKLAGAHQSRINRYHGAYDIKHRDKRPPKAGGKGQHSKFPRVNWDDFGVGPNETGAAQVVATPQELQQQRQDARQHEAQRSAGQQPWSPSSSSQAVATSLANTRAANSQGSAAPVDRNTVHQQLEATREDYQRITGERAPRTNWQLSFEEQYAVLQAALEAWWQANRRARSKECPQLTQRGRY